MTYLRLTGILIPSFVKRILRLRHKLAIFFLEIRCERLVSNFGNPSAVNWLNFEGKVDTKHYVLGCRGVPGLLFYPESINAVVNIKTFIHRAGNPK